MRRARRWEKRHIYRILVRKHEGKWEPGRPRRRKEDIIKTYIKEIGLKSGVESIQLAQDRDSGGLL
jgi:hypothetical protein